MMQAKTTCGKTVADLARQLGFDLALWESHHTLKKDAPSGTAKTLAKAAGVPNDRIASTRVGAVVGEHTLFLSQGAEELRFSHTAHSRKLFADGAVNFCERLFKQSLSKRMYTMAEALNQLMQNK
jgi:4-hydroxy-tetrahydrodipicolinate reductase